MIRAKTKKHIVINLKAIYFNGNNMNQLRCKKKIDEMKKLGIAITI